MTQTISIWAAAQTSQMPDFDCILIPSELAGLAAKKHGESVKVGQAVAAGEFEKLTVKQLQKLAQANSISIARTKKEFIGLLKPLEPGVDLDALKGSQLDALIKKHKIGALRSRDELIALLKNAFAQKSQQETAVQLAVEQAAALKAKIGEELLGLQGLKPQEFSAALMKFEQLKQELDTAKALMPSAEWSPLQAQFTYAREAFTNSVKSLGSKELRSIAKQSKIKHYQWAGKEELIVLMTSDNPQAIQAAKEAIEVKWIKWVVKQGKEVKPQALKAKPLVFSSPPTPVVIRNADEAWDKFISDKPFQFKGKADIDGAHTKYFFTDRSGEKWLFKPVSEDFRAYGDEAAYRIGRLIDPDAVEVRCIKLEVPGRGKMTGSIQKWRTDLKSELDFRTIAPERLTKTEIEQLQREHVIDWLISNHDAHGKQFLRCRDGKVLGIDKGQLFKYLGDDRLALDYHPNSVFGECEPIYNTIMRAWQEGKIEIDLQRTYRAIHQAEKITDEVYLDILRPYAERRFSGHPLKQKQFYETALARKNSLRQDFEAFYTDLLRVRSGDKTTIFTFDSSVLPDIVKKGRWEKIPEGREHLIDEARTAGWQGKSLPVDAADIEDQNVLLYAEEVKGKTRTVLRMKIRPEAEHKLLARLSTGPNDTIGQTAGKKLADDLFYDDILAAVKSVNYHLKQGDFKFSKFKLETALKHRSALQHLAKKGDADLKAMANNYLKVIEQLERMLAAPTKTSITMFEQYLKTEILTESPKGLLPTTKRTTVYGDSKTIVKGKIVVQSEEVTLGKIHGSFSSHGLEYKIDLGDGIEGIYRPWIKENYYAHQGQLEIRMLKNCTPETADALLAKLERLGVEASFANAEQTELMYLLKQAYILKEDATPGWKKMMTRLEREKASSAQRVQALRSYWADKLGVTDVTKLPGYDPEGKYAIMAANWRDKMQAGWRHQYRFDLSDELINKELKGYGLYHQVTSKGSLSEVLDAALENNGAMVSTVEKMRIGVPVGGMSPSADMDTGGASYFFTRIRKLPTEGDNSASGLYFKPTLLRRMDAITYNSDQYGRVTGNHVHKHRLAAIDEFKRIANSRRTDETIFKNSVTILDNIELVAVPSEAERKRVLLVFKRNGITQLPDGRKIEDIVVRTK